MKEIDYISNIKVADSFVSNNKTSFFKGNGEAKLYIGQSTNNKLNQFFYNNKVKNFFILKKDIEDYLRDSEYEYSNQEMPYRKGDISVFLEHHREELLIFEDKIFFNLEDEAMISKGRYYIRSQNYIWGFLRRFLIPIISFVNFIKYEQDNQEFIRLIPFINYDMEINNFNKNKKKKKLNKRNDGLQKKFRDELISYFGRCIVSSVNNDYLLQACHIKPYRRCDKNEMFDIDNGVILTPTFHKIFDMGYMSFDENKKIVFSETFLGKRNVSIMKKNVHNFKFDFRNKKREQYINWHYSNVFKKDKFFKIELI
jgi:putative restriction endonuclease